MTTEEKAKAYDEALTLAKRIISKNCTEVEKLLLKCIFPQLAESEDEKIRMTLVEYFAPPVPFTEVCGMPVQKIRDWLEKQKEQKPIKWTDLTWKDIVEFEGIINNVHYEFSAGIGQKSFGEEVLERFRSTKGDEYPE